MRVKKKLKTIEIKSLEEHSSNVSTPAFQILREQLATVTTTVFSRLPQPKSRMFKSLALASLVGSAVAFSPARSSSVRLSHKVSMSAEFLPGALAPLGYFDPLSLSAGKTEGEVRKIREAELKHGR